MYFTTHKSITTTDETTVLTIPKGFSINIVYVYVINHGGSTNTVDLWWQNGAGVDQMYLLDGTSVGAGSRDILGGQSSAPIFVLHEGEVIKIATSAAGNVEVAITFHLVNRFPYINALNN